LATLMKGARCRLVWTTNFDPLVADGCAKVCGLRARRDLLPALERQEVERVGQKLATERGLAFNAIEDSQIVRGRLIGSTQIASGHFSMIDDGLGFSLMPWWPIIEKEIGREVIGVMRGGDVSWQLGRRLGLGI
jgi:hypothetical protein